MKLLTLNTPKTLKARAFGCLNAVLYLTPGGDRCTSASPGCLKACLNTSGRGGIPSVQRVRRRRTTLLRRNGVKFYIDLYDDLRSVESRALKNRLRPVVRLNATSDLIWDSVYTDFPNIQFVEYTKHILRVREYARGALPKNLYLCFSRSEINEDECAEALKLGVNVCMVFNVKKGGAGPLRWSQPLPRKMLFDGRVWDVIDGDTHDLRHLDLRPVIVGLRAKGRAMKDQTGFVLGGRR